MSKREHIQIEIKQKLVGHHYEVTNIDAGSEPLVVFDVAANRLHITGPKINMRYEDVVQVTVYDD